MTYPHVKIQGHHKFDMKYCAYIKILHLEMDSGFYWRATDSMGEFIIFDV